MIENYKTLTEQVSTTIIEKKSKFICYVKSVQTEDEAKAFIDVIKKENYNANHNCFAYTIGIEQSIERYSDDGEPSSTAGMPMLEVIRGSGLKNIVAVVTRYFGGIKLGTGGLIRAYSNSIKLCLEQALIQEKKLCEKLEITIPYNDAGKIEYQVHQHEQIIYDISYSDKVTMVLLIDIRLSNKIQKDFMEITSGQCNIESEGNFYVWEEDKNYLLETY